MTLQTSLVFFFQAEDGIRDATVTGVQTCALPISLWSVEHHFDDYSMCPDNMQFLSWLAGRTSRVGLGTAAVILPWNNPLRVVEKMILLDHFSQGRAVFGMGRGLAKMEYRGQMIDMNEARERFDE